MGRAIAAVTLALASVALSTGGQTLAAQQSPDGELTALGRRVMFAVMADLDRARVAGATEQVTCLDDVLSQVSALLRTIEENERMNGARRAQLARRLSEADDDAVVCRSLTRSGQGDTTVTSDGPGAARFRHPWMRRDRPVLRVGLGWGQTPVFAGGGYVVKGGLELRAGLGGFVLPRVRLEVIGGVGLTATPGDAVKPATPRVHALLGAQLLVTADLSIFRFAAGASVAAMVASERQLGNTFGWLGVELMVPVELGFELTESLAITLHGGPRWVRPGATDFGMGGVLIVMVERAL